MLEKDTLRTKFWNALTDEEKDFFKELNLVFNTKLIGGISDEWKTIFVKKLGA